ncbi:MAG TPA: ATP-binding protein [Bryobacteraceae bacterium]|nr:ATP-binding protein [Bryobacteraceae bacterium]
MFRDSGTDERVYRLLVENSLGLMCIHDLDGILLSVNPAVSASLGYPPDQGPGQNLRDFLVPAVQHRFDDYLRRIRRNESDTGLMRLQASDGSERIWMYRNTLYRQEGAPDIVLGHALDITERVNIERALRDAKAELRKLNDDLSHRVEERTAELVEANRRLKAEGEERVRVEDELVRRRNLESLGVLAGGIAHDLNNFLTVVKGNAELAKVRPEADPELQGRLDEITAACDRAGFLASQLLTFSKGGSPVRRTVPLARLVLDAVELARAGSAVAINVNVAPDLWFAEIDSAQIQQVLQSVLLNARQAMPRGGIIEVTASNVHIQSTAAGGGRFVRVAIHDYGIGIPADIVPRVFDPYFTTKPGSTGLGLTSAYSIVQKHGGSISVESQPGRGTQVTVDLPACKVSVARQSSVGPSAGGVRWKLLVMDDEEGIRKLLKSVLTGFGHEVSCASDGAEAIALYEAAKASGRGFDAVLLDLTVNGGMGGTDAAARLKEMDAGAKLIVSSGYSDSPVLSEFRKYGFVDILPKPFTPAQIAEVFGRVLTRANKGTTGPDKDLPPGTR